MREEKEKDVEYTVSVSSSSAALEYAVLLAKRKKEIFKFLRDATQDICAF